MKIVVIANDPAYNELTTGTDKIHWQRIHSLNELLQMENVFALFNLSDNAWAQDYSKIVFPVFINSVVHTLHNTNHPSNVVRINGWNGFIQRTCWELSGKISAKHESVLLALQKKHTVLPDQPGFIAARIISMIINEAFYAKDEKVSTEDEIDTAMKLGTNYPKGPFEWKREIGTRNIYELLLALSKTDERYIPSTLLQQEANQS